MIYYNWFGCISCTLFMFPAVLAHGGNFFVYHFVDVNKMVVCADTVVIYQCLLLCRFPIVRTLIYLYLHSMIYHSHHSLQRRF